MIVRTPVNTLQEWDYITSGLVALQKLQPSEKDAIQALINKIANIKFNIKYVTQS